MEQGLNAQDMPLRSAVTIEPLDSDAMHSVSAGFALQGFQGYTQRQRNWCWAAACVSVSNYFRDRSAHLQQCEVVNLSLSTTDCCLAPGRYDIPWSLEEALQATGHLDAHVPGPIGAIGGVAAVVREIGVGHKPVAVRNRRPGGRTHFVVICGYQNQGRSFLVWDPAGRYIQMNPMNWLINMGAWSDTYFTRRAS
jgi:Papain-like cysteine protease AvrRpt2